MLGVFVYLDLIVGAKRGRGVGPDALVARITPVGVYVVPPPAVGSPVVLICLARIAKIRAILCVSMRTSSSRGLSRSIGLAGIVGPPSLSVIRGGAIPDGAEGARQRRGLSTSGRRANGLPARAAPPSAPRACSAYNASCLFSGSTMSRSPCLRSKLRPSRSGASALP